MAAITDGCAPGGRFRAAGSINAVAIADGDGDGIGLREAEVHSDEFTLDMSALTGGANICLPGSAGVEVGGLSLMRGH